MIITFSGIDGAGKSTQASYVSDYLATYGYKVNQIHILPWTLVNRIGRTIGIGERGATRYRRDNTPTSQHRLVNAARNVISLVDLGRFHLLSLYKTRVRNEVIVCDRFFYDLIVHARYMDYTNCTFESIYNRLLPTPELAILLDLQPDLAHEREGLHSIKYYEVKRRLYLKRSSEWKLTVVKSQDLSETQERIRNLLCQHLHLDSCEQ